jgi:hypothetical protein
MDGVICWIRIRAVAKAWDATPDIEAAQRVKASREFPSKTSRARIVKRWKAERSSGYRLPAA